MVTLLWVVTTLESRLHKMNGKAKVFLEISWNYSFKWPKRPWLIHPCVRPNPLEKSLQIMSYSGIGKLLCHSIIEKYKFKFFSRKCSQTEVYLYLIYENLLFSSKKLPRQTTLSSNLWYHDATESLISEKFFNKVYDSKQYTTMPNHFICTLSYVE